MSNYILPIYNYAIIHPRMHKINDICYLFLLFYKAKYVLISNNLSYYRWWQLARVKQGELSWRLFTMLWSLSGQHIYIWKVWHISLHGNVSWLSRRRVVIYAKPTWIHYAACKWPSPERHWNISRYSVLIHRLHDIPQTRVILDIELHGAWYVDDNATKS